MIRVTVIPAGEHIIEPMITLARCSKHQRILVAGANSNELALDLHRHGYSRVATTAHCGLPRGQYDAALVDWRQRSLKSLETTLDWVVDFLGPTGVLVVRFDPQPPAGNRFLCSALRRYDLIVECGAIRSEDAAVCARRSDLNASSRAA